jgi:hypothetical protein
VRTVGDLERELLELKERVSGSIGPSAEMAERVFRRARIRRVVTGMTGVLVAVALGLASAAAAGVFDAPTPAAPVGPQPDEESSTSPSLDFKPADGWHVLTTDSAAANERRAQAWASNVPFAEDEEEIGDPNLFPYGSPDKTEDALPPDGIIIVATYPLQTRNSLPPIQGAPERTLPLTIDERPSVEYEGQEDDRALAIVNATVNGRYVNVRIVFGTGEPSPDLVREADEELARLIVAPPPTTTDAVDDFGIRMNLPDAWRGILFSWSASEPILHVATVPITDLYDGSSAREQLGPDDLFLVLSENLASAVHYEPVVLPISIRVDDACPTCEILDNGTSPPPDHSLYYRSFAVSDRQFDLFLEFGTATPTDEQLARVNDVLATLQIAPPESPPPAESREEVPEAPVSVDLPSGWIEKGDPVPGPSAPRVVAAYGTWDLPTGGVCGPEPALQDLPPDGALVWIVEYANPGYAGDFIPLLPQFSIDLQTPPARWECAAAAPSRMYLFQIGGRFFEVHLALGPGAADETIRQAQDLIKSVRAEPGA